MMIEEHGDYLKHLICRWTVLLFCFKEIMRIGQGDCKGHWEKKDPFSRGGLKCTAGLVLPSSAPSPT